MPRRKHYTERSRRRAFTLLESVIAAGLVGIVFLSLYSGIASGFYSIQFARENLRATQIMLEKMEVIRVLTWSQMTTKGFIPNSFTNVYDPNPNASGTGPKYYGTILITNVPMVTNYTNDMLMVKVSVNWTTKQKPRTREMVTYFSKYGVQNYFIKD